MKVLGLVGSPRREGNTHLLVSGVLDGAREKGAETKLVLLGELEIGECDGCHSCWKGRKCVREDDMCALYGDISASDVLVLGTPVYWYAPSALMKVFIDRLVYFNCTENREAVRGKRAVIAVPFEEKDRRAAAPVVGFFKKVLSYLEMELFARIVVPGVSERGEVLRKAAVMRKARAVGRSLA